MSNFFSDLMYEYDKSAEERKSRQRQMDRRQAAYKEYRKQKTEGEVDDASVQGLGIFDLQKTSPIDSYNSPFMDKSVSFVKDAEGVVRPRSDADQYSSDITNISRADAAIESPIDMYGLREDDYFTRLASSFFTVQTPLGVSDILSGERVINPEGKAVAVPEGLFGMAARANIRKQYEVAEKIAKGTAGFHQFYSAGNLVSIVPQEILGKHVGFTALGTLPKGGAKTVMDQYATMMGYDPRTVDFFKKPGQKGFGKELKGFVPGVGGISSVDNKFVGPAGEISDAPPNPNAHFGLLTGLYGTEFSIDALSESTLSDTVKQELQAGILSGEVAPKAVYSRDGATVIGYDTGYGGVLKDNDGDLVMSGGENSAPVTTGYGYFDADKYSDLRKEISSETIQQDIKARSEQISQQIAEGEGGGRDRGGAETGKAESEAGDDYSSNPTGYSGSFAEGGVAPEGPEGNAPIVNDPGFIGQEPENLPEEMTVADDVAIDVPEGTFIINAAAVEFMGSADVKEMILSAIAEAEKQGIDIKQRDDTISEEDLVSLVVSRGEVIVPPELAKVIGYDRLNKINNRGKAEVEKRIKENGQADIPPQKPEVLQAAEGFIATNEKLPKADITINPSLFEFEAKGVLDVVEGTTNKPHVPTANSGVTIGRGVDLARFLPNEFKRMNVPPEIIEKTKPFLAVKQGVYGPRGAKAKEVASQLKLTDEEISILSEQVFQYKQKKFFKDFPQFKDNLPKDQALAFSAYYHSGSKGMQDNYVTFRRVHKETGDVVEAMDKGLIQKVSPGSTESNRAFNALSWYYTGDDEATASLPPSKRLRKAKEMLEARRRQEALDNLPFDTSPEEMERVARDPSLRVRTK